jgi:uncharacterized 2Fe-2S/4Fe-4S cluster protein (DUF4445 family)
MITVRFEPDGTEAAVAASTLVSEAANHVGLSLHLPCGGRGRCGKCKVSIMSGEVSEPTDEEREALSPEELEASVRLACQTRLLGDAVVELPPEAHVIGTKSLQSGLVRPVAVAPNVHQIPLTLPPPRLEDQRSDFDRVADALTGARELHACPAALRSLAGALREGEFRVVAGVVGQRLVDVRPGLLRPRTLGAAVDIGTTTVVAYIVDLLTGRQLATAATYNEQGRHGADVISRIEYCNTHEGGIEELRALALQSVNTVIAEALGTIGARHEEVYEATIVGNTAMNHLFIGLDPRYLAQAPYIPVTSRAHELRPVDAGIAMHPRGSVFCLPTIAGFVGADTVGVILATEMVERERPALAIDIGTNGEVALWSGERLLVASCAAGPAFEGAQIEHGMRAAPGAIEHVFVENGEIRIKTIGDQPPVGICGSGLFDAMAAALELELVESSGRFRDGDLPDHLPVSVRSRVVGEANGRRLLLGPPGNGDTVYLSQRDVRQIQLAKGAVRAAVDMLLDFAGLAPDDLSEVLLAGAFGNYVNPASALRMGMLPPVPLERILGVGNAAGAGALLALISLDERRRAVEIAASAQHIELSRRPEFQIAFMDAMVFP